MRQIEFQNDIATPTGYTDTRWLELELGPDGNLTVEASTRRGQSVVMVLEPADVKRLRLWLMDMDGWPAHLRALVEGAGQSGTWHSREPG